MITKYNNYVDQRGLIFIDLRFIYNDVYVLYSLNPKKPSLI